VRNLGKAIEKANSLSYGLAAEGGTEGLQCYTVAKNVSHKMI